MNSRSPAALRLPAVIAVAVAVAVGSIVASARVPALQALQLRILDWQLAAAARPHPGTGRVVVVGIDPQTFEHLPTWGPTALDRSTYAPVIEALARAGAAAVAIDIFFTPTSTAADQQLAEAIRRAGNVVVVAGADVKLRGARELVAFTQPAAPIRAAAARIASPLLLRPDGVVRWVKLWQADSRSPAQYPALSLAAVQVAGLESRASGSLAQDPMTIRWSGGPGTIATVRFLDVYRGQFDPSAVKDRVVFIGRIGDEEDLLQTPVGPMYGVEIHAQAAATLIADCAPKMTGYGVSLLAAAGLCLLVAVAARGRRTWQTWAAGGAAAAAWLVGSFVSLSHFGVVLLAAGPALAAVSCALVLSGLQAEATVRSLSRLWPSWVSGGMQEIEATILVCDLAGYTAHAEDTSPVEVMRLLQNFFATVEDTVARHGGVLARRPGDAAIVLFRREAAGDSPAARAVAAAAALRDRLARELPAGARGFGITVASGKVSVGFVGKSSPEPQVLGDPVNVAFRLQGEARRLGEPVLIDGTTAAALPSRIGLRALGTVKLRHRRQPVEIFAPQAGR